ACLLLGCAAGDDDLSDAAGPEQRISMAARVRLRASVHACVDGGVVTNLCAFTVAISGTEYAVARAACGNSFFWPDRRKLCGSCAPQWNSGGESVLWKNWGVPHAARVRAQRNALLSSLRSLQARRVAGSELDRQLLSVDRAGRHMERRRTRAGA